MKKKIRRMLLLMTVSAVLVTTAMVLALFYSLFYQQVYADLKNYADILQHAYTQDIGMLQVYDPNSDELRVTLIDEAGDVLYDSEANPEEMNNHNSRPEIQEAIENGSGTSVRQSDTIGRSTFYYAVRMENGEVLRVARETGSIWGILAGAVPGLLMLLGLVLVICYIVANYLTNKLIHPIISMADRMDTIEPYQVVPELQPFISTIQKQHQDILKGALMRQEFTANVSHELKTPLTAISGYAELIASGMADNMQDVQRFAEEIKKSSGRLLTLINDIIQLSELDTRENQVSYEMVDLYDIVQNCSQSMEVSAENHQVKLRTAGRHCSVRGNREQLEEVVYNLCDNAIRYNKTGGSVLLCAYAEEDGHVCLVVEDTGIGIPKEHQERIFERFYRVDKSRSKSTGGTGLGLAIVKHIVIQHGAEISVQSETGKGTQIRVDFPIS